MAGTGMHTWTVTYTTETIGTGATGLPASGVKVGFKLGDGTESSVFVPDGSFTAENVRTAIAAKATTLAGIKGLSG